jgi:glucosamine-phosphate N-acetyltransferase
MSEESKRRKQDEEMDEIAVSQQPQAFSVSLSLTIRPLNASDFAKNFFPLLGQLSSVGNISQDYFAGQLKRLHADSMQQMFVCEDSSLGRIVATGTMVIEPKFIHRGGYAGHLEDLVVDHALRAKGIGQRLVEQLKQFARAKGCYKVIVDCGEHNVPFYEKCGFKRKEMSMAVYFHDKSNKAVDNDESGDDVAQGEEHGLGAILKLKAMGPEYVDGLVVRPLAASDYDRSFLQLLSQLTTVGEISREFFSARVASVLADPLQHIVVIDDPDKVCRQWRRPF